MRKHNYSLTDIPVKADGAEYASALKEAVELLSQQKELLAIYQIGGTSAPGISDLDVICVFENNKTSSFNLLSHLSSQAKYFFIHNAYGVCLDHFKKSRPEIFFQNCKLIYGQEISSDTTFHPSDLNIKGQIALQFLLKMYIVMTIQQKYNIIKVRSFLLEGNGLKYDMDFISKDNVELIDAINLITILRRHWFEDRSSMKKIRFVFSDMYRSIERYLQKLFTVESLLLPENYNKSISSVAMIISSSDFNYHHSGITLPSFISQFAGRKYFNLQNRFNKFSFKIPIEQPSEKSIIEYFNHVKEMRIYNTSHLPHFLPLSSSLKVI